MDNYYLTAHIKLTVKEQRHGKERLHVGIRETFPRYWITFCKGYNQNWIWLITKPVEHGLDSQSYFGVHHIHIQHLTSLGQGILTPTLSMAMLAEEWCESYPNHIIATLHLLLIASYNFFLHCINTTLFFLKNLKDRIRNIYNSQNHSTLNFFLL